MKQSLMILSVGLITVVVYFAIIYSVELCYAVASNYRMPTAGVVDFSRSLWIYYKYILPYILLFVNILLVASKNKILNRILLAVIYGVFIGWYWGSMMFGAYSYPYRALLVLLILTVFYALDLFVVCKIGTMIKLKIAKK